MPDSREVSFLTQVAARLGRPRRSGIHPPAWPKHPADGLLSEADREALVRIFAERLAAVEAPVIRTDRAAFAECLSDVLVSESCRTVMYGDDSRLEELGVAEALDRRGISGIRWKADGDETVLREEAARADAGIAFAEWGIAETGTLVLWNGGGRGRLVSLLPPVFVAVIREESLLPRMTDAVRRVHGLVGTGLPACLNFISGPSRTGDIEMDLALGVHGPGVVRILLLCD